jgi:hypothetical protein
VAPGGCAAGAGAARRRGAGGAGEASAAAVRLVAECFELACMAAL